MATTSSDAVDQHLLALDRLRGLRAVITLVDRFARLDPKIAEARRLITERFAALPPSAYGGEDVLEAVLWLEVREQLKRPGSLYGFRLWIGDGDAALRGVEQALETTLTPDVLNEVAREASQWGAADSAHAAQLQKAQAELAQIRSELPEDNPLVIAYIGACFVAGFAAGFAAAKLAHHHSGHRP